MDCLSLKQSHWTVWQTRVYSYKNEVSHELLICVIVGFFLYLSCSFKYWLRVLSWLHETHHERALLSLWVSACHSKSIFTGIRRVTLLFESVAVESSMSSKRYIDDDGTQSIQRKKNIEEDAVYHK